MSKEGFQLNAAEIAEQIHCDIVKPGWHLSAWLDAYAHPDFETGSIIVHDSVDRAIVVFVGSREEAQAVADAARRALDIRPKEGE